MDGGSYERLRAIDSQEMGHRSLSATSDDDSLGAVRGLMMALVLEAAVIAAGWGAWHLISGLFG